MTPIGTTFAQSPAEGEALAHDMRVRWALEEVGQPYEVFLHAFRAMQESTQLEPDSPEQISADEECELSLFESGATVIDIAAHHPGLLPVMRMPGRTRSGGCLRLSIRLSRQSLSLKRLHSLSETSRGTCSVCLFWRGVSAHGWARCLASWVRPTGLMAISVLQTS